MRAKSPAASGKRGRCVRLPLGVAPERNEPQSSWLARIAWEHRCSVLELLAHCGVTELQPGELQFGLCPSSLIHVGRATGVPAGQIAGLASRRLLHHMGEPALRHLHRPTHAAQTGKAHLDLRDLRCCPTCLRERTGARHDHWLHRMSYCCLKHRESLVPLAALRQALGLWKVRPWGPPGALGVVHDRDARWLPISTPLELDSLDECATRTLQDILEGRPTIREGTQISPADATAMLWATTLMLARFMRADDLQLDNARRRTLRVLETERPAGQHQAHNIRKRPEFLAAIVPSAWMLALGPKTPTCRRLIDQLAARVREDKTTNAHTYYDRLPPWLTVEIATALTRTSSHRLLTALSPRVHRSPGRLAATHIPQMLWPTLFAQRFAALLPGVSTQAARVFCSIALLRFDHCNSLKSAERVLGQRGERAIAVTPLLERLQPWEHKLAFAQQISDLRDQLAGHLHTDYSKLRRAFEHQHKAPRALAEHLTDVLDLRGHISMSDRTHLLSDHGRAILAAWIWVHAIHCRLDASAAHKQGLKRDATQRATFELLRPVHNELIGALEDLLNTPLAEPLRTTNSTIPAAPL